MLLFVFQYDINGDGLLELVFSLSTGEIRFYRPNGSQLIHLTYQVHAYYQN